MVCEKNSQVIEVPNNLDSTLLGRTYAHSNHADFTLVVIELQVRYEGRTNPLGSMCTYPYQVIAPYSFLVEHAHGVALYVMSLDGKTLTESFIPKRPEKTQHGTTYGRVATWTLRGMVHIQQSSSVKTLSRSMLFLL